MWLRSLVVALIVVGCSLRRSPILPPGDGGMDAPLDVRLGDDVPPGDASDAASPPDVPSFDAPDPVDTSDPIDAPEPIDVGRDAPIDTGRDAPVVDTGVDAPVTPPDAGGSGVICGSAVCRAPQICCVGFGLETTYACTEPSDCRGTPASCDGPEDCMAGQACCGMNDWGELSASCASVSGCTFRICHDDGDCPDARCCTGWGGIRSCAALCL